MYKLGNISVHTCWYALNFVVFKATRYCNVFSILEHPEKYHFYIKIESLKTRVRFFNDNSFLMINKKPRGSSTEIKYTESYEI